MKKNIVFMALLLAGISSAKADERPVVLELFTSQGCSSCPPADALLQQLAKDPGVLALSFHVHYWDYLGWRDPFSSEQNTNRQRHYAQSLHTGVFTPQLIVDGAYSAVGSDRREVASAMASAQREGQDIPLSLSPEGAGHMLNVHVGTGASGPASVFAVRYQRHASIAVSAGENSGRTLTSINNVTEFSKLGVWNNKALDFHMPTPKNSDEGVAVLLQNDGQGRILAAGYYPK